MLTNLLATDPLILCLLSPLLPRGYGSRSRSRMSRLHSFSASLCPEHVPTPLGDRAQWSRILLPTRLCFFARVDIPSPGPSPSTPTLRLVPLRPLALPHRALYLLPVCRCAPTSTCTSTRARRCWTSASGEGGWGWVRWWLVGPILTWREGGREVEEARADDGLLLVRFLVPTKSLYFFIMFIYKYNGLLD